ncbi:hypothetical protein V2J09_015804 [Rumex salicifolius]
MSITAATYKVNLHCPECAHRIKAPLLRISGVHKVDVNYDKSEVKVIGVIDAKKIHQRIEKIGKKKVEIIKVEADFKETIVVEKIVTLHSTTIKVHLHCNECERLICNKLLRHKGIYNVKSDMKAQSLAIEGPIEAEKLVAFIKRKVHRHAEIVSTKQLVKKEAATAQVKGGEKKKEEAEIKTTTTKKVIDVKEVEEKLKATNTPYIVHYVYAPQWFSDEDPNSCCVM